MNALLSERLCANCRLRSLAAARGWESETEARPVDAAEAADRQAERIQYSFGPDWKW